MPSITEYKPINRFPYQFVSPFSYSARSVFYSSITIDRNNENECFPCAWCGETNKLIKEQAERFRDFNESFDLQVGPEVGGSLVQFTTVWQTQYENFFFGNPWTISPDNLTARLDWELSCNCVYLFPPGTPCNNQTQRASATATIVVGSQNVNLTVSWQGLGETQDPNFELMQLYLDGVLISSGNAPGGKLGCEGGDAPIVRQDFVTFPILLLAGTTHNLNIEATTNDPLYHITAYYQFTLNFVAAT